MVGGVCAELLDSTQHSRSLDQILDERGNVAVELLATVYPEALHIHRRIPRHYAVLASATKAATFGERTSLVCLCFKDSR